MRIVIDKNIPLGREAFQDLGEVLVTTAITADAVRSGDILIVRSETKVDRSLLEGSRIRFVGTATIGTDHIDIPYLESRGIPFASAPGCNANSVKEYVIAALLTLSHRLGFLLKGRTIGVVGVGNIGSKVVKAARALGMEVLQNDPPLARATGAKHFLHLDDLMGADIVTLHVPLTRAGSDPTYHLFDERRFSEMKRGAVLINTSRGGVIHTPALMNAIGRRGLDATVLDVWENEPAISAGLLSTVTIGTSHIAGYSLDGKVHAVRMIRQAVCRHFSLPDHWEPSLPAHETGKIQVFREEAPEEEVIRRVVRHCYDIEEDDRLLRTMLDLPESVRKEYFVGLRTGYRIRREFSNVKFELPDRHQALAEPLSALGFNVTGIGKGPR